MESVFEILVASKAANQLAGDLAGREIYSKLCVVTNNEDPEGRRRVKVADPSVPGLETTWLRRATDHPFLDAPLPEVGQTVLCNWIEGDQSNGFYSSIQNDTNPPFQKEDVIKDSYEATPGNRTETTGANRYERTSEDHHVSVGQNLLIENDSSAKIDISDAGVREDYAPKELTITAGTTLTIDNLAGASVTLLPSGAVVISSADGTQLILGGATAGIPGVTSNCYLKLTSNAVWDLNGQSLTFQNVSDLKIGNKSIAVVGAVDSAGHPLVTRGY